MATPFQPASTPYFGANSADAIFTAAMTRLYMWMTAGLVLTTVVGFASLSGGHRTLRLSDCPGTVDRNPIRDALGLRQSARVDPAGTLLHVYRCGRGDVIRGSRLPGRNGFCLRWR